MKRALSIVFVFVFISCTSCGQNNPDYEVSDRPTQPPVSESTVINIYRPPVGDFVPYSGVDDWETLIKERYGVEIKLNYLSPLHQSAIATADYYPKAIIDGDISGLIELNVADYRNLSVLMEEGLIYPLSEYLDGNEAFSSLSAVLRDSFKMDDGLIWALPAKGPAGIGTRYLRTEWLETLGLEQPLTLDELFAVSKAFTYDDPNGNELADEHGMDINRRTGARMLLDIFIANECYLSNYAACSIGYDYSTGAYEEAALKPGMLDSLTYIKSLHDEGVLKTNNEWGFLESETLGNLYDFSNFVGEYDNFKDWTHSYTLNGNADFSIVGQKPRKCYVLTSNTENPEETINSFINTFYSNIEGMALGALGVPDSDFTIEGNNLTHIYEYKTTAGQSNFNEENIWLTSLNIDLIRESGINIDSSYFPEGYIDYEINALEKINELYVNNMLYTDSFFLPHQDYKTVQLSFVKAMYISFLTDIENINPEEFVKNYIESQKKAGADKILNEINQKLGISSTFHY